MDGASAHLVTANRPVALPQGKGEDDSDDSDAALVARAQRGEIPAFERLARRHVKTVLGLLRQGLGDEHRAEDAAQEALWIAFRQLGRLDAPDKFATWLYRIALREGFRLGRIPSPKTAVTCAPAFSHTSEEARVKERRTAVREAVGCLEEPYRLAVTLRYLEGLNAAQIAARLKVPHGTVRAQLSRALPMLREKLRRYL